MTVETRSINRAPRPSSLADVLDVILDKGIVIDAYVRVAVVGIELLTIDARVVIASVDTYLRFAEAVNRLDIQPAEQATGLPGMIDRMSEGGARSKTRGALSGVRETAESVVSSLRGDEDDQEPEEEERQPARKRRSSTSSSRTPARTRRSRRSADDES
jgi:gas vesicle structural protein